MTAAAGVQSGDVQVMFNPQGATYDHLKTLPNGMFIGGPVPFSNDISFNLKSPGLSDKRVRQAFIYAPDRPSLLSAFFPDRARLANAAMKQDAWRNTALDNLYPFDAAKAKQLPQDANWDSRKQLNFITYHSDRNSKDLMAALQQAWQDVGINIKITFQDTATFVPAFYQKHQYDVAYIGGMGDYYPDALRPYASWGNMLNAAVSIEVIQSKPWIGSHRDWPSRSPCWPSTLSATPSATPSTRAL